MKKILCLAYLPLSLVFQELLLKLWCFGEISPRGLLYTTLLTGAFGCLLSALCSIPKRFARRQATIWLLAAFLLFGAQGVYYRIFKTFLALFSITKAAGVFGSFFAQALIGIWRSMPFLLPNALPLALWLLLGKRLCRDAELSPRLRLASPAAFVLLQCAALLCINGCKSALLSPAYLYRETLVPSLSMSYFGLVTTTGQDARDLLRGIALEKQERLHVPEEALLTPEAMEPDARENKLSGIDLDALIAGAETPQERALYADLRDRQPSEKNAMTGRFAGKNLIWILGESFSPLALDEAHTPTLCKLSREGFHFENFYVPLWGVSTSDGEYATLTGLIPKYGLWSFSRSRENYMPFSLAKLLGAQGYAAYGYHDHAYNYYDRDKSHPNMGYLWRGRGNGLSLTEQFPESDLELVEATTSDYVSSPPFHVYYLTVSGHMYYDFSGGNAMASKHEAETADLPYSDSCRAYIACNMELDAALERLLGALEAAGELENTVIALSGDHYPYALGQRELEELHGGAFADSLELYRGCFILWSGDMASPLSVTKPCSSLDIMPTLANLFGLPYDSRLVMGRDIFAPGEGFVPFADHSFLTERGRYIAPEDRFYPTPGAFETPEAADAYARERLEELNGMFRCSEDILLENAYARIFRKRAGMP